MDALPPAIREVLFTWACGDRALAWLELNPQGELQAMGGDLATFALDQLAPGSKVEEQLDFLSGVIDPDFLPLDLPLMETANGTSADVHLFMRDQQVWVLLKHSAEKEKRRQVVQQRINEMSLAHHHQSRILNQYLGKEVAERLHLSLNQVESAGERRTLTMMFADIRGFTSFSEKSRPEEVFEVLNIYLGVMIPTVLDAGGVLDKIIGDEVMAIFGMLPGQVDAPDQALQAGINMLVAVENLNRQRGQQGSTQLQLGIGIATGPVSLGVLGSEQRKSITVIGNHVNLASRLQEMADANQLILDQSTFAQIGQYKEQFSRSTASLRGYSDAVELHRLELSELPDLEDRVAQL